MEKLRRFTALFLTLLMLSMSTLTANAALQAVGPTDPLTTIPAWYQDTNNLALVPCIDQNGFCLLPPPFDPLAPPITPITTTGPITDANFPGEGFYFSADTLMPIEAGELARLTFVLEFAFLGGVIPNTGTTFLRTDLQKMRNLALNATYRVTHPYGTFEFTTDAAGNTTGGGGVAVRQEDGTGTAANYLPPLMKSAFTTNMGPFLTPASGIFPTALVGTETHTYIGDAVTPVTVTGSPTGNNFFRIERLSGTPPAGSTGSSWQINTFTLSGRIFTNPIPSPLNIDRASYARDANGGQIDMFVTALPNAVLTLSGTGITTGDLTSDTPATGKFFTHIPFAGTTLPSSLVINNSLDNLAPVPHPVTLVDELAISHAVYNPVSKAITIRAASRDKVAPLPTLTAIDFAAPNTLDATGLLVKTLTSIPPEIITVASSKGGRTSLPVSVVIPSPPPVAVDDTAQTTANAPVTINVLVNDTTGGTLDQASIVTAAATNGTAVANPNGTVTFTPANGFSGPASFTYTVKDTLAQVSNSATVTVTVFGTSPVTGLTLFSNVPSPQLAGTLVSFDASASGGSGNYEYRYWLRNQNGVYSLVQDYSPATVWTWDTTGLPSNSDYAVAVQARSVGSVTPSGFDQEKIMNFRLNAPSSPGVAVNVTPNLVTPQVQGSQVYFTAAITGGTGTYEYQFWLKPSAGTAADYVNVQPYGLNSTWKWDTTAVTPGSYTLAVQARVLGSPNIFDAETVIGYVINPLPTAATALGISTNLPSGQPAGTQVFVTGTASGGTVPYEYQFWLKDTAGVYTLAQPFSTSAIWHWDTTGLTAGTYTVAVQARSQGSTTTGFNVESTIPFDIQ